MLDKDVGDHGHIRQSRDCQLRDNRRGVDACNHIQNGAAIDHPHFYSPVAFSDDVAAQLPCPHPRWIGVAFLSRGSPIHLRMPRQPRDALEISTILPQECEAVLGSVGARTSLGQECLVRARGDPKTRA